MTFGLTNSDPRNLRAFGGLSALRFDVASITLMSKWYRVMSGGLQHQLLLCVVIALSICGCQNSPGNSSQSSAWTDPWRRGDNTSKGSVGIDARAREIERNLGVH